MTFAVGTVHFGGACPKVLHFISLSSVTIRLFYGSVPTLKFMKHHMRYNQMLVIVKEERQGS
jgi:hypothetical protein